MLIFGRLVIYTNKINEMAAFYVRQFGYEVVTIEGDRIVELRPEGAGTVLMLHPASVKQKEGQVLVKLVFDLKDVPAFGASAKVRGLVLARCTRWADIHSPMPRTRQRTPFRNLKRPTLVLSRRYPARLRLFGTSTIGMSQVKGWTL